MLLFSHGPLLFCKSPVATGSEECIVLIVDAPAMAPAVLGPVRIIKVDVVYNSIAIPIEILEDIIKVEISAHTVMINSSMNLVAIYSILVIIVVNIVIVVAQSDRVVILIHLCINSVRRVFGIEISIVVLDTLLALFALSLILLFLLLVLVSKSSQLLVNSMNQVFLLFLFF